MKKDQTKHLQSAEETKLIQQASVKLNPQDTATEKIQRSNSIEKKERDEQNKMKAELRRRESLSVLPSDLVTDDK